MNSSARPDIRKSTQDIVRNISTLPVYVTTLDLSTNLPSPITAAVPCFRAIPTHITTLNLSKNQLGRTFRSNADVCSLLAAIPSHITHVDLSGNEFDQRTPEELAEIFAAIPATVTSLSLSMNNLDKITRLQTAFARFSRSLTSLDLSWNNLHNKTGAELQEISSALPRDLLRLNLSWNGFGLHTTGDEFGTAVGNLPPSLDKLDLSGNDLHYKSGESLRRAFLNLPRSLKTFILGKNGLGRKLPEELAHAFAGLPLELKSLDLSFNEFGHRHFIDISKIWGAIPRRLINLDLRMNGLYTAMLSGGMWQTMLSGLPPALRSIDLRDNGIERVRNGIDPAWFGVFFRSLPLSVETVAYTKNGFQNRDTLVKNLFAESKWSFYLKCFEVLATVGGVAMLIAGLATLQPILIGAGVGLTVAGAAGLANSYGLFSRKTMDTSGLHTAPLDASVNFSVPI